MKTIEQNKKASLIQRGVVAATLVAAPVLSFAAEGDGVDVSAGVTVIASAVGIIALVGAAKIVPNATMQVWSYVKQAFNRT